MILSLFEFRNYTDNVPPFGLDSKTIVDRIQRAGEDFELQDVKTKFIVAPKFSLDASDFMVQNLPQLLKYHDKYWVIAGESKVNRQLAAKVKFIQADVIDATNCDWLFNTPKKHFYSVKANETLHNWLKNKQKHDQED